MMDSQRKLGGLLDAGKKALAAVKETGSKLTEFKRRNVAAITFSVATAVTTIAACDPDTDDLFGPTTGTGSTTSSTGGEAGSSSSGGSHAGGSGSTSSTGGGGFGGGPIVVDVSETNSTLELTSPTVAEINNENVGVEGNGIATGLFVATIKDVNGVVVPNRAVSLDETSGPGTPAIDAVDCATQVSLGNTPSNESVTDDNGEACFKASHATLGTNTFAATEKTSNPDVVITDTANLTFCNRITITSPQHNHKVYTDAPTCNDSFGLELNPGDYCILPPFVATMNTSDFLDKHAAIFYSTKPMTEIRFRSLGTTSAVSDSQHDSSCTNPLGGANNQPADANILVAPNYKYQYPGTLDPIDDQAAMVYLEQ